MNITTRGSIKFSEGNEDPMSSDVPNIYSFEVALDANNINRYVLYFSVDNCASLVLEKSLIDEAGAVVGKIDRSQIAAGTLSKVFNKDKTYKTKFKLIATNKNGSVSAELEPIDVGTDDLNVFATNLITSFSAERSTNSYDEVDVKITIAKIDDFNIQDLDQLELRYQRQDFSNYLSVILNNKINKSENLDASGNVSSYSYEFKKVKIIRPSIGGFFNFFSRITVKNFQSQDSDILTVQFLDLSVSQPSSASDSSFPEAQISDPENPASLRYEFLVKFSEVFIHQKNRTFVQNNESSKQASTFTHKFLDSDKVSGLDHTNFQIKSENQNLLFYYEFNNSKSLVTKGYVYPASVSDILPCVIVNKNGGDNDSIVLFWKINDNFFDYSMMKESVFVETLELKAKLQYKQNGSYIDITEPFTIERKHFQNSTQKFIIEIKKIQSINTLFNSISEEDNKTDNLKIVVVSHTVVCSTKFTPPKTLVFDKLLIPDQWTYIAYDKYILKDANTRSSTDDTISLDLDNPSLKGIRLPEKGFKKFDTILGVRSLVASSQSSFIDQFDCALFYKLSCSFNSFYLDPIREGTISAIVLPKIPDDTFLVAPKVKLPEPNLKKIKDGGVQAEAVVNLDEYGKISAIQLTEIGEGYSYFKTYLDKRKQTFSDFTPIVKSSYTILASDSALHNRVLIPQNASFDLDKLKASLSGGVRLASVLADKEKIDSSSDGGNPLSQLQKNQINQYLEDYLPEDSTIEGNSVEPYEQTSPVENHRALDVLDEIWLELSKLYTEKYNNPLLEINIYNEDDDLAASTIDRSGLPSSIVASTESASLTPSSTSPFSQQTNATGGEWSLFELSGLLLVPDGSPALNISNASKSPPWLTLMPLSVRSDGMWSFGPLPNMAPRAEMFNRIVTAINSLNEVRVIAPFIWLVTQRDKSETWLEAPPNSTLEIVSFSKNGKKVQSGDTISDFSIPINSSVSVLASRSVQKTEKKGDEVSQYGLDGGIYVESFEAGSSVKFKPVIHPFLIDALPRFMTPKIKRKYLGVVRQDTFSCSSYVPLTLPGTNTSVMYCGDPNGDGFYPKVVSTTPIPISKFKSTNYFEFFNSGGSISAEPYGSAKFFGVQTSKKNGYWQFCGGSCGDSYAKSIDFVYTNMYPATYKL